MNRCVLSAVSAAVVVLVTGQLASAQIFGDYNLIVFGNVDSQTEVEGRAFVGGNLSGSASNYGILLTLAQSVGRDTLRVGGNITAQNINVNNGGDVRRSGARSGNLNLNGGGIERVDASVAAGVSGFRTAYRQLATDLSNRATTSPATLPGPNDQPQGVTLNAVPGNDGIAVFRVSGSSLLSNNKVQQIDINLNGANSVIINVLGTSVIFDQGNFVGNFNTNNVRSRVVWNFFEATGVNTGSRNFNGSVLAPFAALTNQNFIAGTVVAESFFQRGEVHLPTHNGDFLQSFVPSPSAAALLALAGLAASRRRRTA